MKKNKFMKAKKLLPAICILLIISQLFVANSFAQQANFLWAKSMGGASNDVGWSIVTDATGNVYTTGNFQGTADFDPGAGVFNLISAGSDDIFISKIDPRGNFVWAKSMGSTGSDNGNSIVLDASGNVYITGCFYGTVDFDPGAGIFNLTAAAGVNNIFIAKFDASGNFVWAKQMVGAGGSTSQFITLDASGNIYTTGEFNGTVDFDPGAGISNLTAASGADIFISKLDALGNYVWAKSFYGPNIDDGLSLAVDASGNVYSTGYFWGGSVDFDPGAGTYYMNSAGGTDIFISKLDASGTFVWAKQLGSSSNDYGVSIALDASGNVYTTGNFIGTVDFDPGVGTFNLASAGSTDIFISKLDASGNFVWAKSMGGTGGDGGSSLVLDASGNIYTTGSFSGTADFDPSAVAYNLTSAGSSDVFISKLDASGNFVWAKAMGGTGTDGGNFIDIDAVGNIYTTGSYSVTADFNPDAGTFNLTAAGGTDIFVEKLVVPVSFYSAQPCFSTTGPFGIGVGTSPRGICSADFNNDGKMDLATSDMGSANVAVLIGDGTGAMTFSVNVGAGTNPRSVVSADFNADGKADLAVANNTAAGTVNVLLGNGNGTFSAATPFAVGNLPSALVSGDFNGDGNPDLAVANNNSNNVFILLGNGSGGFSTSSVSTAAGGNPTGITTGYFNADPYLDLAVSNSTTANVSILIGSSSGTFTLGSNFSSGSGSFPMGVVSADFNGDGKADLATANAGNNNSSVLLGNGDGTFGTAVAYGASNTYYGICKGDFNADGKIDLATVSNNNNNISVQLGNGNGTFQASVTLGLNGGTSPYSICSADFNGDGKPDLATANNSTNNASVLLNTIMTGSTSQTNVSCMGGNDGAASANLTGGVSPYTYYWNPNNYTTQTITGLLPQNYSVTVTSASGCTATATVSIAQRTADSWVPKANFGGLGRYNAVGFSIGSKGYVGTGWNGSHSQDWWEWDQASNIWTQKANFPGTGRDMASGFSIGTRGYIAMGYDGSAPHNTDLWEYNPNNNTWTAKTSFIGTARWSAACFSIGAKGYLGTGYDGTQTNGFWAWDQSTNAWTQLAAYGGPGRSAAVGFSIGNKGYIGTGGNGASAFQDFWEYDPGTNAWASRASFPGTARIGASGFSIGTKGYIGAGGSVAGTVYYKDFWEWDQASNTWNQKADFGGTARYDAVGFAIGNKGYIGTGYDGTNNTQDFWEYTPTLTATISAQTNVSCNGGNNGSATVSANGGFLPYTYTWSTVPAQASATATNLTAGIYSVTISDCSSIATTATVSITQPAVLSVSVSAQANVSCHGMCNGSATASATGGVSPYSYSWNTTPFSQTTQTATGLCFAGYLVTVTDINSCTATANVNITQPAVLSASAGSNQTICSGGNTALIGSAGGGTPNYNYNWSPAAGISCTSCGTTGASPTVTTTYTLTATDANGCTKQTSVAITVNQPPSAPTAGSNSPVCSGQTLSLTASTIIGSTYNWSGPNSFSSSSQNPTIASASIAASGIYSVTATLSGCTGPAGIISVTVNQTPAVPTAGSNSPVCSGQILSLTASTLVGATYSWNGPNSFSSASQNPSVAGVTTAASGTYSVTTTLSGCTGPAGTSSVTVNPIPTAPTASATPNPVNVGNTLSLSASTIAGATYNWYGPGYSSSLTQNPTITNVTTANAGTYSVTATVNGCTSSAGTTSVSVSTLQITTSTTSVSCNGGNDGAAAVVSVTGGSSPYTYSWSTLPVQTTQAVFNLTVGVYTVTVTEAGGSSATASVNIAQPSVISVLTGGVGNVSCYGGNDGTAHAIAGGGTSPYYYSWNTFPVQTIATAANLSAGTYVATVTDANGCTKTATVSITQPNTLIASTDTTISSDCGTSNGSAKANAHGGTLPYTYLWNTTPAKTTQSISNLASGTYSFTVTDAKGCTSASTANVGMKHPNFNLAFSGTPQNGVAPLPVTFTNSTPSIGNYNFAWYWGDGNNVSNNNATVFYTYNFAGTYDVALIATSIANGCKDTLAKHPYINVTGAGCTHTVTATPSGPINKCLGDTAVLTASTNAVAPFTYQWNIGSVAISGANSNTFAVTQSGYYSCTVIKGNCPVTSSAVQINFTTHPQQPIITSSGTIVPCVGGAETLTASSISGVTYSWNTIPVQTTLSIVISSSSNYVVTVTNIVGCTDASAPFTVNTTLVQVPVCMITVDTTSSKNLIVWDKPANAPIDSFRIYREIASTYKHVGSVAYTAQSEFIDNTNGVNPNVTSYKYKISILDSCGHESVLSSYHRSMHLQVSLALPPNSYNLSWNDYIGIPITQYRIMRDSANKGWKAVDSVSFGNNAWTDTHSYPAGDSISYYVEIDHPGGCLVNMKNPQPMTIALNSSRSNVYRVGQNPTSVINTNEDATVLVYPNPSNGFFTIDLKNNVSGTAIIKVFNMIGEEVTRFTCSGCSNKTTMDLSKQAQGVYYLQISTARQTMTKKIVIE